MSCKNNNCNSKSCNTLTDLKEEESKKLIRSEDGVKFYDDEFIFYQEGNIPVIVTFPHSGKLKLKDIPIRKSGCIDPDWWTEDLAICMIQAFNCISCCCGCTVKDKGNNKTECCKPSSSSSSSSCSPTTTTTTSEECSCCNINISSNKVDYKLECPRPYIVYSKIHREMCDFNRGESSAFEDERMKPHYQLYHDTIKSFISKIKSENPQYYDGGKVTLLDIHGQSDIPSYILRGTKDTNTVKPMLKHLGNDSFIGENSIFGYLLNVGGIDVFPLNNLPSDQTTDPTNPKYVPPNKIPHNKNESYNPLNPYIEHPEFNGAFTVINYSKNYTINCIQVEIGYLWRSTIENRIKFSRTLRSSILNFINNYV
ncbi:hypothetical protein ACTFIW_004685 [Dictyostelium discoideum]